MLDSVFGILCFSIAASLIRGAATRGASARQGEMAPRVWIEGVRPMNQAHRGILEKAWGVLVAVRSIAIVLEREYADPMARLVVPDHVLAGMVDIAFLKREQGMILLRKKYVEFGGIDE